MANVRDWRGDELSLTSFYYSIPRVTRTWLTAATLFTLACGLGFVPFGAVLLDWDRVLRKYEIWRPLTASFLLGPLGLNFLFDLVFLYRFSKSLETGVFMGSSAEYTWMLVVIEFFLCLASMVLVPLPILGRCLMMAIMHVWSRKFPRERVHIFVFAVPAAYLSFALLAINTLLAGRLDIPGIVGVLSGHLFYFLDAIYPSLHGHQRAGITKTPSWMYRLFGERPRNQPRNQRNEITQPRSASILSQIRGHHWGTGQRLGSAEDIDS
jgi:Derlin-2/3